VGAGRVPGWLEVLRAFFRLGLISFGGPVAHIGYFRDEFVNRRRWVDERTYADIVAFCQFLPGPASSQVGLSIGLTRAGIPGAFAAWAGFTAPSAILMALFAYGVTAVPGALESGWLHALKVVAVAVVAQAVWGMAQSLCPDRQRASIAVAAALIATLVPGPASQIAAIVLAAIVGRLIYREEARHEESAAMAVPVARTLAVLCLAAFFVLLVGLPVAAGLTSSTILQQIEAFYRAGSLVFGGGHVVLPLLEGSVVAPGWISEDNFLAGYGAAQAVPGPLFTFSAYLGAIMETGGSAWSGAAICLVAIFLPSFLLVLGGLPFWERLRRRADMRAVLLGINAGVVGLLAAALYDPVWTSAIRSAPEFALALTAFLLLTGWKVSPWIVVLLCAGVGLATDILGMPLGTAG